MICRRVLGCFVGWESSDPGLRAEIEALTQLLPASTTSPEFIFSLEPEGEQVVLRQDGAHATPVARSLAFSVSMQWLLAELYLRTDLCLVHAGMVEKDGAAMLLPAMSGRGKSTLTTALLGAGFRFGSDELAPLDREGNAWPYSLPIRIREDALARLGELPANVRAWPVPMFRKDAWTRFLIPTSACAATSYPVRMLVFPSGFHRGDEPELRPISPGEAAIKLMAEQLGVQMGSETDFRVCADLAARVPCYDVVAGDPHRTAKRLAEQWERA